MRRMRRTLVRAIFAALLAFPLGAFAESLPQDSPVHTDQLLADAGKRVKAEQSVFVVFHASWCGWCRKLDRVLAQPEMAAIMEKHFVTVRVDVLERPMKRHLENPGGRELLERLGGRGGGMPFLAMLDPKSNPLATSVDGTGENIGYPGDDEGIEHFLVMVKKAAPKATAEELETLRKGLDAARPAR